MKYKLTLLALLFSSFALAQSGPLAPPSGGGGNAGYQGTMSATSGQGAANPNGANSSGGQPTAQGSSKSSSSSKSGGSLKSTSDSGHYNPADCKTNGGKNVC
ncbi:MAG: hypothetical protein WCP66_10405 [Methylococcales bacterium]